jgi:hypothetical protein
MDWPQVAKYRCLVSSQGHREEIITDLFTQVNDPQKGLIHGGMIRHAEHFRCNFVLQINDLFFFLNVILLIQGTTRVIL